MKKGCSFAAASNEKHRRRSQGKRGKDGMTKEENYKFIDILLTARFLGIKISKNFKQIHFEY
ncbi:hypothetical protein [Robertkochia flava]|uniref:hypothetical protein n=1 Tax=Robertkochia flava TaxID=3447986 RepID=UPI001CCF36AD|nr:hypothetical protein [Robertkochia marina]